MISQVKDPMRNPVRPSPSRKILLYIAFIYLLLSSLLPPLLAAQTDTGTIGQRAADSTVVLTATSQGLCGTGFILENGLIVTTWHVVDSICGEKNCGDLKARRVRGADLKQLEVVTETPLSVKSALPGIDLAFLDPGQTGISGAFKLGADSNSESRLYMAGFPNCRGFELSEGLITRQDSLHIYTTLRGAPGNSGSPIFNDKFEIVGMADEAGDLLQGLTARALNLGYEMRGLRGEWLARSADAAAPLELDAEALLQYYRKDILTLPADKRLLSGLGYISATGALRSRLVLFSDNIPTLRLLGHFDDYPLAAANLPNQIESSSEAKLIRLLALSTALEQKGLRSAALEVLNLPAVLNELTDNPDKTQAGAINALLNEFATGNYPGVELYLIKLTAHWLLWGSLLIAGLTATTGYAYGKQQGGRLSRLAFAIGVAFFWPFSILYLLFKKRNR